MSPWETEETLITVSGGLSSSMLILSWELDHYSTALKLRGVTVLPCTVTLLFPEFKTRQNPPSPYTTRLLLTCLGASKADNFTQAQLYREARELEKSIGKERQDFKTNYEAQLAALNEDAVAHGVQSDQIGIKKAFEERHQDEMATLLARHQLELATLQSETDDKIKQAIAEAAKTKENLKNGLKKRGRAGEELPAEEGGAEEEEGGRV